jgi:hypothetical protein
MKLEIIMLSEINQIEKDKYLMFQNVGSRPKRKKKNDSVKQGLFWGNQWEENQWERVMEKVVMIKVLYIHYKNKINPLKWEGETRKQGRGNLIKVRYMHIWKYHNEIPLYN